MLSWLKYSEKQKPLFAGQEQWRFIQIECSKKNTIDERRKEDKNQAKLEAVEFFQHDHNKCILNDSSED